MDIGNARDDFENRDEKNYLKLFSDLRVANEYKIIE